MAKEYFIGNLDDFEIDHKELIGVKFDQIEHFCDLYKKLKKCEKIKEAIIKSPFNTLTIGTIYDTFILDDIVRDSFWKTLIMTINFLKQSLQDLKNTDYLQRGLYREE